MEKIVSVEEMQAIEREADAKGLTYAQMMENAGRGLADKVDIAYRHNTQRSVLALVGTGNNGGDALVALNYLSEFGWKINAYLIRPRKRDDQLIERVRKQNCEIFVADTDKGFYTLLQLLKTNNVLIDGVLGTGIRLPLHEDISVCLNFVRQYTESHPGTLHVVSVDCPSGVDCDDGQVTSEVIPSEITVTMAAIKRGLISFPAADLTGILQVVNIGNLQDLVSWEKVTTWLVDAGFVQHLLPTRPRNSHKGSFGTALIIAGSMSYTGAAYFSGNAAYRIGAGLVQMAIPSPLHTILAGNLPEAIWLLLPHQNGFISAGSANIILDHIGKATAFLLGPGLGLETGTQEFVKQLFNGPENSRRMPKLVIDADGLKLLTGIEEWYHRLPPNSILTPHPGEMSVLCGLSTPQIQDDRIGIAQKYAVLWKQVVVLKGAYTVIASPNGETAVIPVATPALARAGTGDVLAGLIVGLLAQGVSSYEAAVAGAWIHANAGLRAEKSVGAASVLAGDLLELISEVLLDINSNKS